MAARPQRTPFNGVDMFILVSVGVLFISFAVAILGVTMFAEPTTAIAKYRPSFTKVTGP